MVQYSAFLIHVVLLHLLCLLEGSAVIEYQEWPVDDVNGWSMTTAKEIIGWKGQSAVLPCNFTHPLPNYQGAIRVIWKMTTIEVEQINNIFECTVTNRTDGEPHLDACTTWKNHCRLAGNPRRNNLSLEIKNLTFMQEGLYYCRVELVDETGANWETRLSTKLIVQAPAKILNLTDVGNATVLCVAAGNPKPNISWDGLPGWTTKDVTSDEKYTIKQEITVKQNGTYTCVAMNEYGRDVETVVVGKEMGLDAELLVLYVLVPLILVLMLVLLLLCWKRKGFSCRSSSKRNHRDTAMLSQMEVKEPDPQSGSCDINSMYSNICKSPTRNEPAEESQDGCQYADINFTKKPKQGNKKEATGAPQVEEEVTYAVVAVRKDKQDS